MLGREHFEKVKKLIELIEKKEYICHTLQLPVFAIPYNKRKECHLELKNRYGVKEKMNIVKKRYG